MSDALAFKSNLDADDISYVILFQGLSNSETQMIRKSYSLHPVLDYECASDNFNNKDHILNFPDYYLLTVNTARMDGNIEKPVSMKIIVFKQILLIFCKRPLYSVKQIFTSDFGFKDVPFEDFEVGQRKTAEISCKKTEIGEKYGCQAVESILYKLFEWIFARLELFSHNMDLESKVCMDYSTGLSVDERLDYILRLSLAEKNVLYLQDLIKPKFKLFEDFLRSPHISDGFKVYLNSLKSRTQVLKQKNIMSQHMLEKAQHIFNATLDDALSTSSMKLSNIIKFFSGIATICLPANYVPAMMGMNVKVPFVEEDSLWPFIGA